MERLYSKLPSAQHLSLFSVLLTPQNRLEKSLVPPGEKKRSALTCRMGGGHLEQGRAHGLGEGPGERRGGEGWGKEGEREGSGEEEEERLWG